MLLAKYLSIRFSARTALLAASAIMAPVVAFTQNAVTGIVVDQEGIPLPGAQVNIQQTGQRVTTNVISADSMGRLPDPNIAEALQRVPGFGVERDQGEGNFVSMLGAP